MGSYFNCSIHYLNILHINVCYIILILLMQVNAPPLAVHYRLVNWLYDNPFKMIAACGSTVLLAVLNQQFKHRHLTFSQRIMCSRIFAQAGLVGITITILSFREFMDRRGRYQPERLDMKESI